jgi:hypothetical protein
VRAVALVEAEAPVPLEEEPQVERGRLENLASSGRRGRFRDL